MYLASEATLQTSLFWLNLAAIPYIFTGGNRSWDTTTASTISGDERLIKCAFVGGLHDLSYHFWSHDVQKWLQLQSTALNIEDETGVSTVIDNAKTLYRQTLLGTSTSTSVDRYLQMHMLRLQHQDYVLAMAPYISALKTLEAADLSADQDVVAMVFM